jgi:2-desacetyl-2-hydroxyethyl bacteriochlorophyllide A dehydrogenase
MTVQQLWFTQPGQLEIREQPLAAVPAGNVQVKSICSAISAGTEMLVYRGQLPADIALDATLNSLQQSSNYPLQYGYACVGRVQHIGLGVDPSWLHKQVFAFQPHASHFICPVEQLIEVPEDIEPEAAVFLANMETAVNLVMDGAPLLGERVLVLGQGVVGLLLSSLLAQFPLTDLYALEGISQRRARAHQAGVHQVYDPGSAEQLSALKQTLNLPAELATAGSGADLIYEVSGVPAALNLAIELCSYSGRIVIASWYGNKSAPIQLGGTAHRNRIKLLSSQVSSIAPELTGRFDKARRFQIAWQMIRQLHPQQLISHRATLQQAHALYQQLDQQTEQVLQAVFNY